MKIFYHCYGGAHSSVTAASIHLGLLPTDRIPNKELFLNIPLYDRQETDQHGHIFFMGMDGQGNDVYVVARRSRPQVLENVFIGLAEMFEIPPGEYKLVNVMANVNLTMKLGGYLSRRWGMIKVGRPIVTLGTQAAYFKITELVRNVKAGLGGINEKDIIFQRQPFSPCGGGRRDTYGKFAGGGTGSGEALEPSVLEYNNGQARKDIFHRRGRVGE